MPASSLSRAIKIFFSYAISAPKDKRLFEKLTAHLSVLRRQQLVDEWYDSAISAGSNITQMIEAHLSTADIIVLLISADFFASERCYELEMKRALELSLTGATRLIPVLLSPADWDASLLNQYRPLPPDGTPVSLWKNRDAALSQVAKGIRRVVEELASRAMQTRNRPLPPKSFLSEIPYRHNVFFTDRETSLAALSSTFASTQTQQTSVLALNGLGGMGKTQIALEYIHHSSHLYQTVLWLNASSRTVLSTEVSTLADQLSLPEEEREDEQRLFTTFKHWLQKQTGWLLVLDQINDVTLVDLIIPSQSSGHVLLTTRTQTLGGFASGAIPITAMAPDASVLFLLRRARLIPAEALLNQAPIDMQREAAAIAYTLDDFPLALDQAGAYLEETGCSLNAYLDLYRRERATLLSQRGRLIDTHNHPDSVTITLALAFEQVSQKHTVNLELLHLLAFLQPDAIPEDLIMHGAAELNQPLQVLAKNPLIFYQALADLRNFSLIHHGTDRTTLCVQRIVQDVLIDALTTEQQHQWASMAVRLVNHVFPEVRFDTWAECKRYLPQAQHCARLLRNFQLILKEGALLLERLSAYCSQQACYTEAESYLTQALDLYEQHLGADSADAAQILHSLAQLYYRQARYVEAIALNQQALELRERVLGPDHPKTAESLHNLAVLYGEQGEYQQAEQFYQRVLSLDEHTKGTDHPDTAKTLNNLGLMYYLQGHYTQAETIYQQALAIYEHSLPANHPDLAYTLNSLGALSEKRAHYQQAEAFYQRALAIREQALGDEHPDTAYSLNKLADIYEAQEKYQQAAALYQRALTISEQALGPEHPDIALFLNNLAFLAQKQGQYQQAAPIYQRALSIYEQAWGADHPSIASVLNNLGQLSRKLGNEDRAEVLLRHALDMRERLLGTTHPDTAQSLSNLADLLSAQQMDEEAIPLFQQALAIRLQAFGPYHPDVILVQEKYASLLEHMGRNEEAIRLRQAMIQRSTEQSSSDNETG